jgi:hypothetical protein
LLEAVTRFSPHSRNRGRPKRSHGAMAAGADREPVGQDGVHPVMWALLPRQQQPSSALPEATTASTTVSFRPVSTAGGAAAVVPVEAGPGCVSTGISPSLLDACKPPILPPSASPNDMAYTYPLLNLLRIVVALNGQYAELYPALAVCLLRVTFFFLLSPSNFRTSLTRDVVVR